MSDLSRPNSPEPLDIGDEPDVHLDDAGPPDADQLGGVDWSTLDQGGRAEPVQPPYSPISDWEEEEEGELVESEEEREPIEGSATPAYEVEEGELLQSSLPELELEGGDTFVTMASRHATDGACGVRRPGSPSNRQPTGFWEEDEASPPRQVRSKVVVPPRRPPTGTKFDGSRHRAGRDGPRNVLTFYRRSPQRHPPHQNDDGRRGSGPAACTCPCTCGASRIRQPSTHAKPRRHPLFERNPPAQSAGSPFPMAPFNPGPSNANEGAPKTGAPQGKGKRKRAKCGKCGSRGHPTEGCKKADIVCQKCRRVGHIKRFCPEQECEVCDKKGHTTNDCPDSICPKCQGRGHKLSHCPSGKK